MPVGANQEPEFADADAKTDSAEHGTAAVRQPQAVGFENDVIRVFRGI
jgi:hypothetical protein